MAYIISMASEEYGSEDFRYETQEDQQEGLERLKTSCMAEYQKDGVVRRLTLIKEEEGLMMRLGQWETDNLCPKTLARHTPDWTAVRTESDGGEWYIEVRCVDCGQEGCVGTERLENAVTW